MDSHVLNSWKEIAQYLGHAVRTVERWEKELGLPVRRPWKHLHSSVIAIPTEIDEWLVHERHIANANYRNGGGRDTSATGKQLAATSQTIHQRSRELQQELIRMTAMIARLRIGGLILVQRRHPGGSRMALDTKTLEELEQLANNLRQQIRLRPNHSKLEEVELREVEEWIAVRRRDGEGEKAAAA